MPNPTQPAISIALELDPRINFALQQNNVPVIKSLQITNDGETPIRDLEIAIEGEPEFLAPWKARVALVEPHSSYRLAAVDLALSPRFLGELTERMRGQLRIAVRDQASTLAEQIQPIELLARNEWGGTSSLPEILAAFVMPNHPTIDVILRQAATLMGEWTGSSALDGYQSRDPRRAYTMVAAIYTAIAQAGLTYINPPASFESEGQRVRLPDQILETKFATCLDLTLLAAACIEQVGLNPVLVLLKGHALPGVWLTDECFADAASDDGLRLRKRIDLHDLAVFETTAVTSAPPMSFDAAANAAKERIRDVASVACVIDVARARKGRIRPLPERAAGAANSESASPEIVQDGAAIAAPDLSGLASSVITATQPADASRGRIDQWCNKLLDLTLRNRLLNFRETKKTLTLMAPNLAVLEDLLAEGASLQVLHRPRDFSAVDPRDPATYQRQQGTQALADILAAELRERRIYADTTQQELDRRLVEIYRTARTEMEEGGASALYLALGFLSWFETDQSTQSRLAPILLVPVEVERKSVQQGFSIRLNGDDPRINVTLLEMLKRDFGLVIDGLDPLPEDENGLDVPGILRRVREAVKDIPKWDVRDEARVGFFSFAKFLMWRDLKERSSDLTKNPVVDHLVNRPTERFDAGGTFPKPEHLDDERKPNATFCPVPADSSQLAAVFAAAEGRSFVLEGPPGTGKSQTITNLISHCLASGKTVLFVAEKMAALNVVHARLSKAGLGRFCLELHSSKAHKQKVIGQLGEALQEIEAETTNDWEQEASRLESLRSDLNAYVRALHRKRTSGETVFQATSRLIGHADVPQLRMSWESPDVFTAERLANLRDLVARVGTVAREVGEINANAWRAVRRTVWTHSWESEVREQLKTVERSLIPEELVRQVAERLGIRLDAPTVAELVTMRDIARLLLDSPAPPQPLLVRPDWSEVEASITKWIALGRVRDKKREALRESFEDSIIHLDLDQLRADLKEAEGSWWPASWWRRRKVARALRTVSKRAVPGGNQLAAVLEQAISLRGDQRALDSAADEARTLLGQRWNESEADWQAIESLREWTRSVRSLALTMASGDLERAAALRRSWSTLATEGVEMLRGNGPLKVLFSDYDSSVEAFRSARHRLAELLDLDVAVAWGTDATADALGRTESYLRACSDTLSELRAWCGWRLARAEAVEAGLAALVDAYEQGLVRPDELSRTFERAYAEWWVGEVTEREPVLSRFLSAEHERKIQSFRQLDDRYMDLTRKVILERMAERVPRGGAEIPNSELGILTRETKKRRGHAAVRQLLQRIPNLLPRLKPCLLMSPMSVAQYLSSSHPPFDVVVFDEASQIPVWDAIGALGRGSQAIIVGDPKQLPPTSFFSRAAEEEEVTDDMTVEDLESILDDCLGAGIPWLHLDWHYRSRHESLIAFSNHQYYESRLLTFPAARRDGAGISWEHVSSGVYDKSRTRTNRAEAEAVVKDVLRRLNDPTASKSIGIVTFSLAQQTLIEDLLDEARAAHPGLDRFFSNEEPEPVFVKNLENVQGDERDVILFSICYGPDATGRVSMNFGPMNRDGGERRLNVAVTRAKHEVKVFSTLRPEQIDLTRTRARGVSDLKLFLEYAQRGPSVLVSAIQADPDATFDSPFEEMVCDALTRRGWTVHKQVGCARYRIDLAVVDPDAPGRYLLGIECDGANYHRAKTARDRDKLRQGVLEDLGWTLHRIWSTDWWTSPKREIEKLDAAIRNAQASPRPAKKQEIGHVGVHRPMSASAPSATAAQRVPISKPARQFETYRPVELLWPVRTQGEFFDPANAPTICAQIQTVVDGEGPISVSLAAKRVTSMWGFERVRSRTLEHFRNLIQRTNVQCQKTEAGEFLWPTGVDPTTYSRFRVADANGNGARQADEIPPEEIASAVLHILRDHMSAPVDELVRHTARLFGFQRTGSTVDERVRLGIRTLVHRGRIRLEGDVIALSGASPTGDTRQ